MSQIPYLTSTLPQHSTTFIFHSWQRSSPSKSTIVGSFAVFFHSTCPAKSIQGCGDCSSRNVDDARAKCLLPLHLLSSSTNMRSSRRRLHHGPDWVDIAGWSEVKPKRGSRGRRKKRAGGRRKEGVRAGKQAVEVVMLHVLFQRWVWENPAPGNGGKGCRLDCGPCRRRCHAARTVATQLLIGEEGSKSGVPGPQNGRLFSVSAVLKDGLGQSSTPSYLHAQKASAETQG